jgi:dephospho-CoA kinase
VIGLIGGIGSGKSAVGAILEARGAALINADGVGHELLRSPEVRDQVVARFGQSVLALTPSRSAATLPTQIDRAALGAIVFADPARRRELEAILHPLMRERFLREIEHVTRQGKALMVVLDAAILVEAGWDDLCDGVVFVDAPRDIRLARVAKERGWDRAALELREAAQWPCEKKRSHADLVLRNASGIDALNQEVAKVDDLLGEIAGAGGPEPRARIAEHVETPSEVVG